MAELAGIFDGAFVGREWLRNETLASKYSASLRVPPGLWEKRWHEVVCVVAAGRYRIRHRSRPTVGNEWVMLIPKEG